jgi:hypothetical protein
MDIVCISKSMEITKSQTKSRSRKLKSIITHKGLDKIFHIIQNPSFLTFYMWNRKNPLAAIYPKSRNNQQFDKESATKTRTITVNWNWNNSIDRQIWLKLKGKWRHTYLKEEAEEDERKGKRRVKLGLGLWVGLAASRFQRSKSNWIDRNSLRCSNVNINLFGRCTY